MSYIGRDVDNISNVEKLDNITFDGSATYALEKSSVAYTPSGANNILISIDGVVQMGNFSTSTSNIVFDWSPTSSNTCDWILHYGTGLITTPADGTVTLAKMAVNSIDSDQYVDASIDNAHLADDAVGVAELSATGTASSSTFLRGDNAWASAGGANTPAFEAYLPSTQNIGDGVTTKITASTERFDTDGEYDHTTNYRFTPQTAGKYFVYLGVEAYSTGGGDTTVLSVQPIIQKNGSTCLFAYDWQPSYGCRMFSSRIFGIIDMNGSSDYVEPFCSVWVSTGDGTLRGSATRNTLFGAFKVIT